MLPVLAEGSPSSLIQVLVPPTLSWKATSQLLSPPTLPPSPNINIQKLGKGCSILIFTQAFLSLSMFYVDTSLEPAAPQGRWVTPASHGQWAHLCPVLLDVTRHVFLVCFWHLSLAKWWAPQLVLFISICGVIELWCCLGFLGRKKSKSMELIFLFLIHTLEMMVRQHYLWKDPSLPYW